VRSHVKRDGLMSVNSSHYLSSC